MLQVSAQRALATETVYKDFGIPPSDLAKMPKDCAHTHFICVRFDSAEAQQAAREVQEQLCLLHPPLKEVCTSAEALHLTLGRINLAGPAEVTAACEVLGSLAPIFQAFLSPSEPVHLCGVDAFGEGRLLYTSPDREAGSRLTAVAAAVQVAMHIQGKLTKSDVTSVYEPHTTLLSMRPKLKDQLMQQLGSECCVLPQALTHTLLQAITIIIL